MGINSNSIRLSPTVNPPSTHYFKQCGPQTYVERMGRLWNGRLPIGSVPRTSLHTIEPYRIFRCLTIGLIHSTASSTRLLTSHRTILYRWRGTAVRASTVRVASPSFHIFCGEPRFVV